MSILDQQVLPVNYYLAVEALGLTKPIMPIPYVQNVDMNRSHPTQVTYTFGDEPVREYGGDRGFDVTVTGRSGYEKRLGTTASGSKSFKRGTELFLEFVKWMQKYVNDQTETLNNSGSMTAAAKLDKLIFTANEEKFSYYAVITAFNIRRAAASSPFTYEYTLTLRAYRKVEFVNSAVLPIGEWEWLQSVNNAMDSFAAVMAQTREFTKGFADGKVGGFGSFMNAIDTLEQGIRQAQGMAADFDRVMSWPDKTARALKDVFVQFGEVFRTFGNAIPGISNKQKFNEFFLELYAGAAEAEREMLNVWGGRMVQIPSAIKDPSDEPVYSTQNALDAQSPAGTSLVDLSGVLVVPITLQENWTLEDALVSVFSRFTIADILFLNNMPDPTTLWNGTPLQAGSVVNIPVGGTGNLPVSTNPNTTASLYGQDLLLSADGDLVAEGTDPSDVLGVTGSKLIEQALTVRLLTERGQHSVYPGYGLNRMIGEPADLSTAGVLVNDVRGQVLSDPRITNIARVQVVDGGDTFTVDCVAETPLGPDIPMTVPVPS